MDFSLEHIAVPATDPVALKNWYERALGGNVVFDNDQQPPTYLVTLKNVWLEIYAANKSLPDTADNKLAGFRHLALRVASIEAARVELEKRGVKFTEEIRPAAGSGKVLYFEDCEGNLLHLVERPADFTPGR